jgi:subtilisin family serine protease
VNERFALSLRPGPIFCIPAAAKHRAIELEGTIMTTNHRILAALLGCAACLPCVSTTAFAQASPPASGKILVKTQDDLPRFTYPITGTASALLTADDATFLALARKVGADVDGVLAKYDIADHATLRGLLAERETIQMLTGDYNGALKTGDSIRALEDKPDAKLLSGIRDRALIAAIKDSGASSGPAFQAAYTKRYAAAIDPLPWAIVGNRIKESKGSSEIASRDLFLGQAQAGIDPAVAKTGTLSSDLAAALISLRYALKFYIPNKDVIHAVLAAQVAAKDVKKPDIWEARAVTLTPADKTTPVNVAIWDSGVDLALFPGRVLTDPHPLATTEPHGLAFDLHSFPSHGELLPLTPEQQAEYPGMRGDLKGFSDLQLSIDSPEATALKKKITTLKPAEVATYFERLSFFANYTHGTHVAGITSRGNAAIRLGYARLTFDWKNVPDLPTEELARRGVESYKAYVGWMQRNHVRVVNMSWGGNPSGVEDALEKNGVGKTAAERKELARKLFAIDRDGLYAALKSAPEILFVCAAGNSNSDSGFEEFIPAGFDLPNLLVVGAVDQAGDEASFTSYGKTVKVDANGYQVESFYPGGTLIRESGTSMASPGVANLAAKLIALDPKLTPTETIDLIVKGATPSADGRRHNISPKASVELLKASMK